MFNFFKPKSPATITFFWAEKQKFPFTVLSSEIAQIHPETDGSAVLIMKDKRCNTVFINGRTIILGNCHTNSVRWNGAIQGVPQYEDFKENWDEIPF